LKLEAKAAGLGNVVAHRPSCRQTLDTPVFVSVHQVYEGISSLGTPPSSNAQMSLPCAPISEIFSAVVRRCSRSLARSAKLFELSQNRMAFDRALWQA
jgi:hypothetical protein